MYLPQILLLLKLAVVGRGESILRRWEVKIEMGTRPPSLCSSVHVVLLLRNCPVRLMVSCTARSSPLSYIIIVISVYTETFVFWIKTTVTQTRKTNRLSEMLPNQKSQTHRPSGPALEIQIEFYFYF